MTTPHIRRLTLQNFLSFGSQGVSVDLLPLNVLIGSNAAGKSNLLEALAILRATAGDLQGAVREGGSIGEYIWKGAPPRASAVLETGVLYPEPSRRYPSLLQHRIALGAVGPRVDLAAETITLLSDDPFASPELVVNREAGESLLRARVQKNARHDTKPDDLKAGQSVISQRRDPDRYPEITFLSDIFGGIALFQEWTFGRRSAVRRPQPTDLPYDFLLPDMSNLGLVLHDLGQTSAGREELMSHLRAFYDKARFISTKIYGGTLQMVIEEEGGHLIPATRLSDGTLRYLCLLAILCHPSPPPVIGIDEPELGLHPDILPTIAELLRKASERTQLFVTTHSESLVSALSDTPESVLVCEATPDGTTMKRLEAEPLREWLEKYSLGEIWRMGEIGGNRW
jgi:predicted ATPase